MPKLLEDLLQQGSRVLIPVLCLVLPAAIPWISGAEEVSSPNRNDTQPIPQPLPFSHRSHAQLGMECSTCHTIDGRGGSAGFPPWLFACLVIVEAGENSLLSECSWRVTSNGEKPSPGSGSTRSPILSSSATRSIWPPEPAAPPATVQWSCGTGSSKRSRHRWSTVWIATSRKEPPWTATSVTN